MENHDIKIINAEWIVPKRYTEIKPIGIGTYGQVCSAFDNQTKKNVAIKKIVRPFETDVHATRTYRELRLLKHMHHENVIGLLNVFTSAKTVKNFNELYFVTHLMEADLNNIIQTQNISDVHVQFLVYQILRGLKYIHSAGIIHRDLKPSNIGVNEDLELKILDFGMARPIENDNMTDYVATRWYRAPEIMLNWTQYNETADIWSVGCIMAELLTGNPLFPGKNYVHQLHLILELLGTPSNELMQKISCDGAKIYLESLPVMEKKIFGDVFKQAKPLAIKLLEEMLSLDANNRMTVEKALTHPYLAYYADPQDEPLSDPYDELYEDMEFDVEEWKELIWEEIIIHVPTAQ